jgi:predicted amidophosphoribosyltransferase
MKCPHCAQEIPTFVCDGCGDSLPELPDSGEVCPECGASFCGECLPTHECDEEDDDGEGGGCTP